MTKRILSFILVITLLTTALITAPISAAQVEDTDSSHLSTQDITVTGEGSVGEMFSEAVNRDTNAAANGVTDVTVSGTTATVALNNDVSCTVVVGIYDESGDTLITTAIQNDIPADAGTVELDFAEELPRYFYLRAYLLDEDCCPLSEQYESEQYTEDYANFLAMTVSDFPADRVMNLDRDLANNFAVLNETVDRIAASDTANIPEKVDDNTYTFSGIDDSLRGLKQGDIFAFTLDGQEEVVKVASVTCSGDTLTVTAADAEMDEVFSYVKINTTSKQPQNAETGSDNADLAATGEDVDFDITYSTSKEYKVGELPEATGLGISGSVTVGLDVTVILYYYQDIREAALLLDCGGKFNLTMLAKFEHSFTLGVIPVPTPIAGIVVEVKSELEIEAEAKVEINIPYKSRTGFRYSGRSGFHNLSTLPQFGFDCSCEGKLYAGLKLTAAVNAYRVAEAGCYAKVGLEAVGTRMPTVSDFKESDHLCRWCIEGNLSLVMSTGAEARFLSKKWEHEFGSMKDKLFDFHYSADNGFGKGPCKNRTEPEEDQYELDMSDQPSDGTVTDSWSKTNNNEYSYNISGSGKLDGYHGLRYDQNGVPIGSRVEMFIDIRETAEAMGININSDDFYYNSPFPITLNINGFSVIDRYIYFQSERIRKINFNGPVEIIGGYSSDSIDSNYYEGNRCNVTHRDKLCRSVEVSFPNTVRHINLAMETRIDNEYYSYVPLCASTTLPPELEYSWGVEWTQEDVTVPESLKQCKHFIYKQYPAYEDRYEEMKYKGWFPNVESATLLSECDHIFSMSDKLKEVTFGENVKSIGEYAFANSGLESVTIPGTVKRIEKGAFFWCEDLREVVIEDGVEEIDARAFADCPNLERVVLPDSIAILNKSAFDGCGNVTIDYDGTVEQWLNIIADYQCDYDNNAVLETRMWELTEGSSFYQNCTILCYPNEDGGTIPAGTGLAATGAPVGATPDTYYRDTEYLIAVEDADNGMLQGGVSYLKQVKADENGELTYQLPDGSPGDGEYLNIYGACRHPSAHFDDEGGYVCTVCGASLPRIFDMSQKPTDPTVPTEPTKILGDADGDGEVSSIDVTLIQRYNALIDTGVDEDVLMNADVDGSGELEIVDATYIQRYLAYMETPYPIGEQPQS